MEKFVLKLIVDNTRGVMARIATLISRKGYNITSICVGSHLIEGEASIILCVYGSQAEMENAKNMLGKLVNVISIEMYHESEVVEKEHCLIKVKKKAGSEKRLEALGAKIITDINGVVVAELLATPKKAGEFVASAKKELDVLDVSLSGTNAMAIK